MQEAPRKIGRRITSLSKNVTRPWNQLTMSAF
jgi:hypothetical protein